MRCAWIWMMAIVIFDVVHSADQGGGPANNGWGRIPLVTGALPAGVNGDAPVVPRLNLLEVPREQGPDAHRGEADSTRTFPGSSPRTPLPTPRGEGAPVDAAAGTGSTQ